VILVVMGILLCLAAVNAIFITWATVVDNRHSSALARALGATPREVSAALAAAQVLPALVGAVLGAFPGGFALFAAIIAITGGDRRQGHAAVALAAARRGAGNRARGGGAHRCSRPARRPPSRDRDAPSRTCLMLGTTGAERSTNQTTCHATCGDRSAPCLIPALLKYFPESALSEVQLRPHGNGGVTGQIAPRTRRRADVPPDPPDPGRHPGLRLYGRTSLIRWGERVAGDAADAHVESTGSTRHPPVPRPTATRTAAAAESTSSAVVAGPRTLLHGDRDQEAMIARELSTVLVMPEQV